MLGLTQLQSTPAANQMSVPPRDWTSKPRTIDPAGRAEKLLAESHLTKVSRTLTSHWLDIALDELVPRKSSFRPELVAPVLANIFMYEYHGPDHIEFRVAASLLREVHGRELTGSNYMDMMDEPDRSRAARRLFGMVDHPCGILVINRATFGTGTTGDFSSYGLPMQGDDGSVRFSIHVAEFLGDGHLPYHSGITGMAAVEARYIDIGAGIPDFDPPF